MSQDLGCPGLASLGQEVRAVRERLEEQTRLELTLRQQVRGLTRTLQRSGRHMPGRKSGLGCCLEHSYDGSCTRTVTEVAGFVPYCTDAAGVKRMHLCVRCTQGHAPEGLGKCSSPRKFR
jgi:hypothetical protein